MIQRTLEQLSKSISSGITPFRGNVDFWRNGSIPWLKTEQLGERNIYRTNEHITAEALSKTSIKLNPLNTIAIAMYGEGKTRGNVSILRSEMTTNQACCNVVLDQTLADTDYIYYFLKNQYQKLRSLSSGVRKNLNSADIKGFTINLPGTVARQAKIARILAVLDDKIEVNNRINAELEGMAKLLYDYWFVQFDFPMTAAQAAAIGKPKLAGQAYRASGGKMIPNEALKREIPEGWTSGNLEKLGRIIGGSTPSTEMPEYFSTDGTPWITPKDLSDNVGNRFIDHGAMGVTSEGIKAASLKLLPAGTVLMSSRAPIGYLAVARNTVTTNQGFKSFVPGTEFSTDYIYFTLSHFMKLIKANASGSTFKEISGGTLKVVQIHLPPVELVKKFTEFASSLSEQQSVLEKQNQELTQLRDWLLPMLMNGQITVS